VILSPWLCCGSRPPPSRKRRDRSSEEVVNGSNGLLKGKGQREVNTVLFVGGDAIRLLQ
jgi:hypothetical protein